MTRSPAGKRIRSALAERLGVTAGDPITSAVRVWPGISGDGQSMTVPSALAQSVVGDNGWWTVFAPPGEEKRRDLGADFRRRGRPAVHPGPVGQPDPGGPGLIYDTVGGSGPLTFEQKFSALFSGKVTSSTLGLISTIGLVLGFVIAVSSFLAAVPNAGASSASCPASAWPTRCCTSSSSNRQSCSSSPIVVGVLGAGVAVALVIPGIATPTAWLQAAGMVTAFLPAMAIVGALVPVHRLLQQRPGRPAWGSALMISKGLAYGWLSARRRIGEMVLPVVTTATGAFWWCSCSACPAGIRAQSASLGHADEINRAVVLIAVTVLLVGVVEVAVATTRTVAHRTRELGVLGANGVPRGPVVAALLVEPVVAAILGAVVGAALAVVTGSYSVPRFRRHRRLRRWLALGAGDRRRRQHRRRRWPPASCPRGTRRRVRPSDL